MSTQSWVGLAALLSGCTGSDKAKPSPVDTGAPIEIVPLEDLEWAYVHDSLNVSWQVWDRAALENRWESGSLMSLGVTPGLSTDEYYGGDWQRTGTMTEHYRDVDEGVLWGELGLFRIGPGDDHRRIGSCDPEFEQNKVGGTRQSLTAEFTLDATYLGETEWKYGQIEPTWEIELNLYDVEYLDERGDPKIAAHVGPIVGLSGTKCDPPGDW